MTPQPINIKIQQSQQELRTQRSLRPKRRFWIILIAIVVLFICFLGYIYRSRLYSNNSKLSGYQAVFLVNGQVYFGKMSGDDGQYTVIKDIYYLQANQSLQSGADNQPNGQQEALQLVKLGNELHGPDDVMHINHAQILFYEDLKSDGRVAQAIAEYKKNQ